MSCIRCDFCDAIIDTDYDVEGEYDDDSNKFKCSTCCEEDIPVDSESNT